MASLIPRRGGYVCHMCQQTRATKSSIRQFASMPNRTATSSTTFKTTPAIKQSQRQTLPAASAIKASARVTERSPTPSVRRREQEEATEEELNPTDSPVPIDVQNPTETLSFLRTEVNRITSSERLPTETEVLELLDRFHQFSNVIIFGQTKAPHEEVEEAEEQDKDTASSTLNDLAEEGPKKQPQSIETINLSLPFREKAAATLCELLYNLVRDPKVFISLTVLQIYVRVQCLLGRPEFLPEIFYLYANKPIPKPQKPQTKPIEYTNPWPSNPKYAVPHDLSDAALNASIAKKDLPLALSIIDTTVATRAFRLQKLVRKASIPFAAVAATPLIAYAGADWVSRYQNAWDPEMAKYTAVAGSLAYLGTVTTLGFVAVTTYNDQMERVVWQPGTKLRDRWLREEERAYFDRVALAWGFQQRWRRGEEQGEEWEALREVIGLREMVLDKTELMDGMQ